MDAPKLGCDYVFEGINNHYGICSCQSQGALASPFPVQPNQSGEIWTSRKLFSGFVLVQLPNLTSGQGVSQCLCYLHCTCKSKTVEKGGEKILIANYLSALRGPIEYLRIPEVTSLQVALRSFDLDVPAPTFVDDGPVAGQYHSVPHRIKVSTVIEEYSVEERTLMIEGVTQSTKLNVLTGYVKAWGHWNPFKRYCPGKWDFPYNHPDYHIGCYPHELKHPWNQAENGFENAYSFVVGSGFSNSRTYAKENNVWSSKGPSNGGRAGGCAANVSIAYNYNEMGPSGDRRGWLMVNFTHRCTGWSRPPYLFVYASSPTSDGLEVSQAYTYEKPQVSRSGQFRFKINVGKPTARTDYPTTSPTAVHPEPTQSPTVLPTMSPSPLNATNATNASNSTMNTSAAVAEREWEWTSAWIKHNVRRELSAERVREALTPCPFFHGIEVTLAKDWMSSTSHNRGREWHITLWSYNGLPPPEIIATGYSEQDRYNYLSPATEEPMVTVMARGGANDYLLDPVPLTDFFSPLINHSTASVEINGVRGICAADLSGCPQFSFHASLNASITAIECVSAADGGLCHQGSTADADLVITQGDVIRVTGTGFVPAADLGRDSADITPRVLIGEIECTEIMSWNSSEVVFVVPHRPAGLAPVRVVADVHGEAELALGSGVKEQVLYLGQINGAADIATGNLNVPVSGGSFLEVVGTGFSSIPDENNVTIAGRRCRAIESTHSRIVCETPAAPGAPVEYGADFTDPSDAESPIVVYFGAGNVETHREKAIWDWGLTPELEMLNPSAFSAAKTTYIEVTGNFTGFQESSDCKHSFEFVTPSGFRRGCSDLVVSDTKATCTSSRGPAPDVADQTHVVPHFRVCGPGGTRAFAFGPEMVVDLALRITATSPKSGSFAGGTVVTVDGAGFAPATDTQIADAFTRNIEISSNNVVIKTPHREVPCTIIAANLTQIVCVTSRFTAGERDDDVHGHSGGGINGHVSVSVNSIGVPGVGSDPDLVANHTASHDDLKRANETTDIVAERGPWMLDYEAPPALLSASEREFETGTTIRAINEYREGVGEKRLCAHEQLAEVAQKFAEHLTKISDPSGAWDAMSSGETMPELYELVNSAGYDWTDLSYFHSFDREQQGDQLVQHIVDESSKESSGTAADREVLVAGEVYEIGVGLDHGTFVIVLGAREVRGDGGACPSMGEAANPFEQANGKLQRYLFHVSRKYASVKLWQYFSKKYALPPVERSSPTISCPTTFIPVLRDRDVSNNQVG